MKYYKGRPNTISKIISMYPNDGEIDHIDTVYNSKYDSNIVTYVSDYLRRVSIINSILIMEISDSIKPYKYY